LQNLYSIIVGLTEPNLTFIQAVSHLLVKRIKETQLLTSIQIVWQLRTVLQLLGFGGRDNCRSPKPVDERSRTCIHVDQCIPIAMLEFPISL